MARLIYALNSSGGIRGGHKMAIRHVEALRSLGFDAYVYIFNEASRPTWIRHEAPIMLGGPIQPGDVVVVSEDNGSLLRQMAGRQERTVVFYQGPHSGAEKAAIDALPNQTIMTVGRRHQTDIRRLFPKAAVELVPCFADERVFRPAREKVAAVAYSPTKRPMSARAIGEFLKRIHPRHSGLVWSEMAGLPEHDVAAILGRSSLFLALGVLESVGLMPLEAMASGCLCAGFAAVGGRDYATVENGFWAPDDDQIAAADALAEAADLALSGGPRLKAMIDAGYETAAQWSYAVFLAALEETWSGLAPEARGLPARMRASR